MIIKRKKYKIGSWTQPYIEHLLKGNYVHNPVSYLEGKARTNNIIFRKYQISWSRAIEHLDSISPVTTFGSAEIRRNNSTKMKGSVIYILRKNLIKFLKKNIIEQSHGMTMYRIEDRNLLVRGELDPKTKYFQCLYPHITIKDILIDEVTEVLDAS